MTETQLATFLARIVSVGPCWLWTGSRLPSQYGRFTGRLTHRLAYEHFIGPIPDGLEIDHLCRTPACVNPTHLEAVPHLVNMRRAAHCKASAAYKPMTLAQRQKIARGLKGHPVSAHTRDRVAATNQARAGKPLSVEHRAKLRAAWVRRKARAA